MCVSIYIVQDINARIARRVLNRALEAFSIAGSIISMIGLILTLITMVGFRWVHLLDLSVYTCIETGEETVHVLHMYSFHFMQETSSAWCQQISCTAMYCHVWYAAVLPGGNRSNRDRGLLYHHVSVHPVLHPSFCVLDGSRGCADVSEAYHCVWDDHREIPCYRIPHLLV